MKRKISVICILVLLSGWYWRYHFAEKVGVEEPLLLLGSQTLFIEGPVLYARSGIVITNKSRPYIRVLVGEKVYRLYIEEEPS